MLLMFVAIIPGANFAGVLGGMVVQKIFFTVAGAFVYVYLFLSVPGLVRAPAEARRTTIPSCSARSWPAPCCWSSCSGACSGSRLKGLWEKAKQGGAILARPRDYAVRVALPSFGAWLAKLGVIAVFLAGYGITVTFHAVMSVMGGNSIANTVSVTPGGVGVNQAANVAALGGVTDASTATAYSLGQQLAVTAWNIAFALVVVVLGVRLGGRQAAGRALVRGRQGQGRRAEGPARRAPRREAGLTPASRQAARPGLASGASIGDALSRMDSQFAAFRGRR